MPTMNVDGETEKKGEWSNGFGILGAAIKFFQPKN